MSQNLQQLFEAIKKAQTAPIPDSIAKAFTQSGSASTGLTYYDLEAPAKTLYPVLTPLRNRISRVTGKAGTQANWRAITGINVNNVAMGVSQGNRGGVISTTVTEYLAAYRGIGLEDYVTFEAEYAAEGFDDVKARAAEGLLRSVMIGEESLIFGGNTSLQLGTTPTPTLAASGSGGSLATQTLSVICVALAFEAYWAVAGLNNGATGQQFLAPSAVVPASITRTNSDGSSDTFGGGSGRKSSNATVSVTGPTGSATATVTAVNGAVGYAWYWGAAGSELLGAISTINSVKITATATGTQTAASMPAADNSTNALEFDGLLTQSFKSGSGSYVKTMASGTPGTGTPLTSDSSGGIVEIEDAFNYFWTLYRLSPDTILMNSQELLNINKKILNAGGAAPLVRFNVDVNNPMAVMNSMAAGIAIGSYLNKITNKLVKLEVHPNCPPGTMFFYSEQLPYKISGVNEVLRVLCRRDYYQIEWPIVKRRYEYGVYADEVLQNYFPPAFGIITNIANG